MNAAHFHLIVNHLPIIFPLVAVIVMIIGLIFKSEAVKRTAFLIFIIGSITSIFAMNSGEGAEEIVEEISGISHDLIEEHEESAELFAMLSYILGGLSLFAFWASVKKNSLSKIVNFSIIIFSIVVLYFAKLTGSTGGEIRHPEIRADFVETQDNHEHHHEDEH